MSRNDKSSGNKFSGRQGGGKKKKSFARGNAPVKKQGAPKTASNKDGIRLNKYVANAGVCSRRDADIFIAAGSVTVNGKVVTEMGYKVQLSDEVKFDGRSITPDRPEYVLLNKPKGFYTTGNPEKGGRTVMDIISKASKSKLDPVGKLDTQASGLLLFTNDGAMAKRLAKPKNGIRQIYHVELNRPLKQEDLDKVRKGVILADGKISVQDISYVTDRPKNEIGLEINSVKNHIVQKLFKSLDYDIVKLDRVVFGGLTKKDLPRGRFRHLTQQEVINLGML
ncbi:pseudouridine synthase [Salegentibacter chungangensis]|uniref:Pseudouridine synthase n=1 Tax=Salegentibacter chungangensis TaxID=1335724 RepID=A0ABW3NMI7_9FLAO